MEYTDLDKAQWILEHGEPQITWIHERIGSQVFARPTAASLVPPWISRDKRLVFEMESADSQGRPADYICQLNCPEYHHGKYKIPGCRV